VVRKTIKTDSGQKIFKPMERSKKMNEQKDGKLRTAAGAPVADNQNVMTAGPRGPMLLQDTCKRPA
jgi:catalase